MVANAYATTIIIDPKWVNAPNPSNWIWIIATYNGSTASLKVAAFPSKPVCPAQARTLAGGCQAQEVPTPFQSGFENGVPFVGGGVIPSSWWINSPLGSPDWKTDTTQVFGTITEAGWYTCVVEFTNTQGVTKALFVFEKTPKDPGPLALASVWGTTHAPLRKFRGCFIFYI